MHKCARYCGSAGFWPPPSRPCCQGTCALCSPLFVQGQHWHSLGARGVQETLRTCSSCTACKNRSPSKECWYMHTALQHHRDNAAFEPGCFY